MKNLLVLIGLVCFSISPIYSQEKTKKSEKFVRHFNYICFFEDGKWGETYKRSNSFVFNINDNGDVLWYGASGGKKYFRKISGVKEDKTSDGIELQSVKLLDEEGYECYLFLYENQILKLVYNKDLQIQFNP